MRIRFKALLPAAVLFTAGLMSTSSASASTISIGLQLASVNGGAVTTEATSTNGSVFFNGNYGSYVFNQINATGYPILQSGDLISGSIQASTNAPTGGTMYVYITEQGLTSPTGAAPFLSSFTSNLFQGSALSVVESTLYSTSNALYGGTLLASDTFTGLGTAASTNVASLTGTYSETVEYAITSGSGSGAVNDTINITSVTPEPSSLVLLGTGLIGAATIALRRRKLYI